jgi:hypothetical protein
MEDRSTTPRPAAAIWFPLGLMLAVLALRVLAQNGVIPNLNLSPLMALAFVGAIVVPRPLPWWSWAMILLGVDVLSQGAAVWHPENLPAIGLTYGCYILAAWWGGRMRSAGAGVVNTLAATVACSVLFYLVTNTFCWAVEPIYAKSFAGWAQCLTTGTPGLPPTWLFFRNSLIADLTGASVLLLAYNGEAFLRGLRALPLVSGRNATLVTA